jgi:peptide/nickel transport system permease protein
MMSNNESDAKKAGRSFLSMFKRLFVRDLSEKNILEEEALRTPLKTIFLNLVQNKLAIIGFIGFVAILLFSFVGSQVFPFSRTYTELTNANIRPSRNFLKIPKELNDKNIVKIVSGVSYSVALTDDGNLTIWGTECNRDMAGVSDLMMEIPQHIQNAHIVDIVSGGRFVVCVDDQGKFYGWGNRGNGQTAMPDDILNEFETKGIRVSKLVAGTQWTAVIGDDGNLYVWGSRHAINNFLVPSRLHGRIVDAAAGNDNMALLLDDGTVAVIGMRGTEFNDELPVALTDGSVRIVNITATNRNVLAMDDQGRLYLWGSVENALHRKPPELDVEKVVYIKGSWKNFIVVDEDGDVFIWGANELKQLVLPKGLKGVERVFADYFQFYAADGNGNIIGAWGNKGYIWGSDQFGRDIFVRIMQGGKISLTVGVVAVVIAVVIAIIVGLSSGFFGGWVDHMLMRVAEVIDSIPFLPLAITLNYAIGHDMTIDQKLYLIMVILGVLGWTGLARLIRALLLAEREKDFVLAARALGIKQKAVMFRHILPNVFSYVIVSVTLSYAAFLLTEAALSFLGFGVQEPTPSWGNMLTSAENSLVIQYYWWRWIIPALFVVGAALSINLVGDALREAMDPKSQER